MTSDAMIGTILSDRYRIDSLLGEGGMGRVYRGEHVLMRKRVAIKILHSELMANPEVVARFEREAMASAHIEHPHVAAATDFGKLPDGSVFLVLEYVEGAALSTLIADGPVSFERTLRIALQIVSALEAAHARGIVHRDLKPDNVLLVKRQGGGDFIKVLDFGVAKVPALAGDTQGHKPITQVGMVYGTPEYMAPEQALGQEVDQTADLYALGVVLYELLSGRRPYEGPVVGLLGQQLTKPLPMLSEKNPSVKVPPRIEAFVRELLMTDKGQRPQSASATRLIVETLLSDFEQGKLETTRSSRLSTAFGQVHKELTSPGGMPYSTGRRVQRSNRVVLIASLGLAVIGAVVAVVLFGGGGATKNAEPDPISAQVTAPVPVPTIDKKAELESAKQSGLTALEAFIKKYPGEAEAHAEVALALAKAKRFDEAVDSARLALGLDPKLNDHRAIGGALFRAAQAQTSSVSAFRLLKGPMGSAGADIVYDLRQTEGITSWVKKQCDDFLSSTEIRTIASPELVLVLQLEDTKSCEEALSLVRKAETAADERALPILRHFSVGTMCGNFHSKDCFPCMRGEPELPRAIEAIKARAAAKK